MTYAGIRILDMPAKADREYDYAVPAELSGSVHPGSIVRVPLRGRREGCDGIVVRLSDSPAPGLDPSVIREMTAVMPDYAALSASQMMTAEFLCSSTLCSFGEAVSSMIPASVIKDTPEKTEKVIALNLPDGEIAAVLSGEKTVVSGSRKTKMTSPGQRAVLECLLEAGGPMRLSDIYAGGRAGSENISALEKKGLITVSRQTVDRGMLAAGAGSGSEKTEIRLNDEQSAAYSELSALADAGKPAAVLLEGVTGSGKTSVMLKLIDRVLDSGKGAILLLPEIALTPQTLSIFCRRYGERVAVMHSGLSAGERRDAYIRIRSGGAPLVIGTRSAVFAPLPRLGLIVIDEEQEHTYKSDSSPRYHARDVARFRCAKENALLLLASATPSLESRYKAETGQYRLIRLTKRYGGAVLPAVTVADMRGEMREGSPNPIGRVLAAKLRETYERGEQSVLFLNRRGYNNYISCAGCGAAFQCPDCSVSMTYHVSRVGGQGMMVCHFCGKRMPVPEKCPSCGSGPMIKIGFGTQKIEEELDRIVPGARVLRMDADTTSAKDSYNQMLGRFRRHEADILLGTQMVTKGHDFPDVTLVGVLLADVSLYYDDYRASERTFALLTQVIGRAGRRERPGEAVIQTNNPDHEIIALAGRQDYEAMYRREIALRRALVFPPFCDIALLTLTSSDEKAVVDGARGLSRSLREKSALPEFGKKCPMVVFGPFEAPVYRVENKYRMRLVVKCRLNSLAKTFFAELIAQFRASAGGDMTLSVDFGPTNL
ncbi:MAG: primosomal protein N' [Clostridia bacterium]|nr:primosomal protein N' [Clostridia bacterium]